MTNTDDNHGMPYNIVPLKGAVCCFGEEFEMQNVTTLFVH